MKIAIGADHAGYALKRILAQELKGQGHRILDLGAHSTKPCDYPDYAFKVAAAVADGQAERGIMICGSGVGAAVAANKVPGIRAAVCHDGYSAHQSVEHDDVNVLCLGSLVIGTKLAFDVTAIWLKARFSKEERHLRRLKKIAAFEEMRLVRLVIPAKAEKPKKR